MSTRARVVFLGSFPWSASLLEAFLADDRMEIPLVLTVPERSGPDGFVNPVREFCRRRGLESFLLSPMTFDPEPLFAAVRAAGADCALSVAYPKRIPQPFLDLFPFGGWNVHPSKLPRWRGPDPVRRAMLAGDETVGCTLHRLVHTFDAGDILWQDSVPCSQGDTLPVMLDRLGRMAAEAVPGALARHVRGETSPRPQEGEPSYAAPVTEGDRWIAPHTTFQEANRQIAALTPHLPALWRQDDAVYALPALLVREGTANSLAVRLADGVFHAPLFSRIS